MKKENIFNLLSAKIKEVNDSGYDLADKIKHQRIALKRLNEKLIDNCIILTKKIKNEFN